MVLNKFTGSTLMDGTEKSLFKIVGTTMKHFVAYVYLRALQAGESIRLRVYNKVDDVSQWKFDGDVTDSVSTNNGTVTNISSWVSQWKFDGDVNDSIGSNNGTITYNTNLKRLYKFESNLNDSTTNANASLTAGTVTYVTGREGKAFSFDGSTYLTAVDTGLPTGNNVISVSGWVYPTTLNAFNAFFQYGVQSGVQPWYFQLDGSGKIRVTDQTTVLLLTTNKCPLNTWSFVTVTYDGTTIKAYINGVIDPTTGTPSARNITLTSSTIGGEIGGTNKFTGYLDELRVYNIALTQAQVSALYVNGKFSQSHTFDNGEYVGVGNPSNLQFERTNAFSISAWVNSDSLASNAAIAGKFNGIHSQGYYFWINTSGKVIFDLTPVSGAPEGEVISASTLSTNIWTNVVVTYDGSSNQNGMKIYINGVLDQTGASSAFTGSILNSNNFILGASTGAVNPLKGQLDEVRVYNAALTASQVLGLYNYTGSNYVTPLPVGNALSLDGSSYVTVPNQTPYNFERTNTFSASLWIKTTLTSYAQILEKVQTVSPFRGIDFNINNGGQNVGVQLINTNGSNVLSVKTTSNVNDGNWHNVIWTYDGSSTPGGIKIYIDGVSQSLTTISNTLSATIQNSNNVSIGADSSGANKFSGLLDEVQIWNYVVSSAEINAINAGRFANTHPIGLWHFDGDLYDYSGQGSSGSPTGTMTYVTGALSGSYNVPNTHFNFDGSEYVDAGNVSNLNFERTQPFSVAFWIRTTSSSSQSIVNKFLSVNTGWTAGIQTNLNLQLANTNNSNDFTSSSSTSVIDGLWHFCVITYDGSSNPANVKFYVDSVLGATNVGRNNLTGSILNTGHVTIGALDTSANNPVIGEIDDLRVYNRALSSAEVSDLFTYPDGEMKSLVYDRTYSGPLTDAKYSPYLQGNQFMITALQIGGTNRIISWEREESSG